MRARLQVDSDFFNKTIANNTGNFPRNLNLNLQYGFDCHSGCLEFLNNNLSNINLSAYYGKPSSRYSASYGDLDKFRRDFKL